MRSLRWAQATADSADGMIHLAVSKVLYNTRLTDGAFYTACEDTKIEIGKQVERVRAVLQPGVTVSGRIIAADKFVVNSTALQSDWKRLLHPDDKDLTDHPWYQLYFKPCSEAPPNSTFTAQVEASGGNKSWPEKSAKEAAIEVERQGKGSGHSVTHPALSSSSSNSCDSCLTRGISCSPQPCRRCLQCKRNRIRCSQVQTNRGRLVSRHPHVAQRDHKRKSAEQNFTLGSVENGFQPDSLAQPYRVCRIADGLDVSRVEHRHLSEGYEKLEQRIRAIEDALLALNGRIPNAMS